MKKIMLILLVLFIWGCNESNKISNIKIEVLKTYGDDSGHIIGFVSDYQYYKNKVYILDTSYPAIHIFNLDGEFIKKIQLRKGKGPGEVLMGLNNIAILDDSRIAILDNYRRNIQIIDTSYNYLSEFRLDAISMKMDYSNGQFILNGGFEKESIRIYDINGNKKKGIGPPFYDKTLKMNCLAPFCGEGSDYYLANPFEENIIKWNDEIIWDYKSSRETLISKPEVDENSIGMATKGWMSLMCLDNYLFASTYNGEYQMKEGNLPFVVVLDKLSGKKLYEMTMESPFYAKTFNGGEIVLRAIYNPIPRLELIKINIE